ncbi:MAG: L,D-transpeptidase family protein, partial [Pseudobdellovibrionaceae bacterium]
MLESNRYMRLLYSALAAVLTAGVTLPSQAETEVLPEGKKYPAGLISLSSEPQFASFSFVVDKSKRTLFVYEWKDSDLNIIAEYPTDIGKKMGDKTKENDHRTPVGIYFLQKEMTQPEIPFGLYGNLAFSTDYPNIFDKRDAKTGSGIWLHAVPDTVPLTRGSRGCVVVRNDVIKVLKSYVRLEQTPILIFDEVKYFSKEEYAAQKSRFLTDFENWRTAWEKQDVDTYIKYYDSTFKNDQMNYKQWYNHKKKLKALYTYIKVDLGPPLILQNKDQIVIRTIQRYESNLHKDFGEKTIHARLSPEVGFQIIREDWKPMIETLALKKANEDKSASAADTKQP